jgi:hypothetical protein
MGQQDLIKPGMTVKEARAAAGYKDSDIPGDLTADDIAEYYSIHGSKPTLAVMNPDSRWSNADDWHEDYPEEAEPWAEKIVANMNKGGSTHDEPTWENLFDRYFGTAEKDGTADKVLLSIGALEIEDHIRDLTGREENKGRVFAGHKVARKMRIAADKLDPLFESPSNDASEADADYDEERNLKNKMDFYLGKVSLDGQPPWVAESAADAEELHKFKVWDADPSIFQAAAEKRAAARKVKKAARAARADARG